MVDKDAESGNHKWSKHIFPFDSHTEFMKGSDAKEGWRLLQGRITKGRGSLAGFAPTGNQGF